MKRLIHRSLFVVLLIILTGTVFATRLVTYSFRGEARLGAVLQDRVIDLNRAYLTLLERQGKPRAEARAAAFVPPNMLEFLRGEEDSLNAALEALKFVSGEIETRSGQTKLREKGVVFLASEVELEAALPNPARVLAVGLNYRQHAAESGNEIPTYPTIFTKEGRVIGTGKNIVVPRAVKEPDYEAELAFVIGKRAWGVSRENALNYVAGYMVFNDVSARDFQGRVSQWTLGKSPDTFAVIGPYLVLKDELPDPHTLRITTRIGQEVLQDSNTSDMIFSVADIVAYVSQVMELQPGTVITTGTPSGVGSARRPKRFLQNGETVTVEVDKLGKVANPVVRETD